MYSSGKQLGGLFDDFDLDLSGLGLDDWFGSIGGGTTPPTTTTPGSGAPTNNFQFLTSAVVSYFRSRDLSKLNRDLVEQGRSPISQAQADYMAQQYRANGSIALPGQTSFLTWLPWIALAGVVAYVVMKK